MGHLTEKQIETFRQRLLAAKREIEGLLQRTVSDAKPVDLNLPIGRLSRMDAIQMRSMSQMNRFQLDIRRQQVDASLADVAAGRYGLCRSCKGPIGLGRLEVLPESPFCVDCQESFEST